MAKLFDDAINERIVNATVTREDDPEPLSFNVARESFDAWIVVRAKDMGRELMELKAIAFPGKVKEALEAWCIQKRLTMEYEGAAPAA
jgi:hypothetical protein